MDLPFEIKNYIENELNHGSINHIREDAEKISKNYREKTRNGDALVSKRGEAIAYAMSRMPATFGAVSKVIEKTTEIYNTPIKSVADIGAGTGSASIAINELLYVDEIDCFEKEDVMVEIGKDICNNYSGLKEKVTWKKLDIVKDSIEDKYDLVISAYMINELKENEFENVIKKIWNISNDMVIIVEPGTFQGYNNIMKAKKKLLELGGNIIAPCMSKECKLPKEDWCNFYCRIQRTKIHKDLKFGVSPFEDEKFMYIAISKKKIESYNKSRIIRHPLIYNGYVKLKTCNSEGNREITITKKEKERFKMARKANQGDLI